MTDDRYTDDVDGDDVDGYPRPHPPSWSDRVTMLRYTLWPTLYTDEHSNTSDLLWQQVLEQRAIRSWLAVGCVLLVGVGMLLLTTLVVIIMLTR